MNNLLELFETTVSKYEVIYKYAGSIGKIISDDDESARFIREVLRDKDFQTLEEDDSQYSFAKDRVRHSVITFLLGLVFWDFFDFKERIENSFEQIINKTDIIKLWMFTSLYHDSAYNSKILGYSHYDMKANAKYYLLTDSYENKLASSLLDFSMKAKAAKAYSYNEIEAYDRYSRRYHTKIADSKKAEGKLENERIDHGILGGVLTFDRLLKKKEKTFDQTDLYMIKTGCLTIAQHNIFKSCDENTDLEYGPELKRLYSNSQIVIGKNKPLLLFLSLVDTFECIKKFGKAENPKAYLQQDSVIEKIHLRVTNEKIEIIYDKLYAWIYKKRDEDLMNTYNEYINALCKLRKWTSLVGKKSGENSIIIEHSHRSTDYYYPD